MKLANNWKDYEIIDSSNGEKIERWNNIILKRPDPQIIWDKKVENIDINAIYHRSSKGGGYWETLKDTPNSWRINYKDLIFNIKLMGFKHTGLFPEQAVNWDYMMEKIKKADRNIRVLNLFAYTGGASVACLKAGASVVHVDSSRGMVDWAKENVKSSNLEEHDIRFIVDDVIKFVEREIRRGSKYDAIVMDPPSYGKGINKEVWDINKDLFTLLKLCTLLLNDNPLFVIVNSYTAGFSKEVIANLLKLTINLKFNGLITSEEIGLPITNEQLVLPCGIYGRFESNE